MYLTEMYAGSPKTCSKLFIASLFTSAPKKQPNVHQWKKNKLCGILFINRNELIISTFNKIPNSDKYDVEWTRLGIKGHLSMMLKVKIVIILRSE